MEVFVRTNKPRVAVSGDFPTYNDGNGYITRGQAPDVITGLNSYTGTTDQERLKYLNDQIIFIQLVVDARLAKIAELSSADAALTAEANKMINAVTGLFLKVNPAAGLVTAAFGAFLVLLERKEIEQVLAWKAHEIKKHIAVIETLAAEQAKLRLEVDQLTTRRYYMIFILVVFVFLLWL